MCRSRPCPSQGVPIAHPVADSSIGQVRGWGWGEAVNKTNRTHSLGEFTIWEEDTRNQEGTQSVWLILANNSRCDSAM